MWFPVGLNDPLLSTWFSVGHEDAMQLKEKVFILEGNFERLRKDPNAPTMYGYNQRDDPEGEGTGTRKSWPIRIQRCWWENIAQ